MKTHFTLLSVTIEFIGEGAPLLLVTKWDMEMLTAMHQNLGDALALAHATTMLLELKKQRVHQSRPSRGTEKHCLEGNIRTKMQKDVKIQLYCSPQLLASPQNGGSRLKTRRYSFWWLNSSDKLMSQQWRNWDTAKLCYYGSRRWHNDDRML